MEPDIKTNNGTIETEINISTENEIVESTVITETINAKIVKQLEYYFGDANFPYDKFLLNLAAADNGWVEINVLKTFKKLASISDDKAVITSAVKTSYDSILEVDETNEKIRRKPDQGVPVANQEFLNELIEKSVYCKGFPKTTTLDELITFAATFGNKTIIKIIPRKNYKHEFKGSAYFVFRTKELAHIFLKQQSVKYNELELERMWEKDFLEIKKNEYEQRKQKQNLLHDETNEKIWCKPDQGVSTVPVANQEILNELIEKSVYCKGFPKTTTLDELFTFAATFGNKTIIRIIPRKNYNHEFIGSAYFVFRTKELAHIFLKQQSVMYNELELERMWEKDFLEIKKNEYEQRKQKQNLLHDETNEKIWCKPDQGVSTVPVANQEILNELIEKSVYCKGFPKTTTLDELFTFAATFGNKTIIRIIPRKNYNHEFIGSAYFVFRTKELAHIFLKQQSVMYNELELERMWEKDFLEIKKKEYEQKKNLLQNESYFKPGYLLKVDIVNENVLIGDIRRFCDQMNWPVAFVKLDDAKKTAWIRMRPNETTAHVLLELIGEENKSTEMLFSIPKQEEEEQVLIQMFNEMAAFRERKKQVIKFRKTKLFKINKMEMSIF